MLYLEHFSLKIKNGFPTLVIKDKNGKDLGFGDSVHKGLNRILNYFFDFELLLLRVVGFIPLHFIRKFAYILAGVEIGSAAHLHMGTQFFNPRNIKIGKGTIIGQNAFLDGRDRLIIGNHVDIASDVMIYNSEHDINSDEFKATTGEVIVEDYVFIGPRVIILPGVKVGRGAVVAAGAVVTRDVEEGMMVGGVPAKVIGQRKLKEFSYKLGRARLFQ